MLALICRNTITIRYGCIILPYDIVVRYYNMICTLLQYYNTIKLNEKFCSRRLFSEVLRCWLRLPLGSWAAGKGNPMVREWEAGLGKQDGRIDVNRCARLRFCGSLVLLVPISLFLCIYR